MVTCTWNFRRHLGRGLVASVAALSTFLYGVAPHADAGQISNLQGQAAAITAQITAVGLQEDALSESYDQTQSKLSTLQAQLGEAQASLASAQAAESKAREALASAAIQAYVDGGTNPLVTAGAASSQSVALLRSEYASTLATDQTNAIDEYETTSLDEHTASVQLAAQASAVDAQLAVLSKQRSTLEATSARLTSLESQVTGQLAAAVAAQQAAQQAAAQKAAAQRAAAAAAAQAAAAARNAPASQTPGVVAGATQTPGYAGNAAASAGPYTPPPLSSAAARAVAAAESRVGDWYQWGAAGPSTFDCSGLVMWAYAQAGISLPHYSGSQYADTIHIPMSDLQPGDLVFFANPGEHVAMYVGGGDVVQAPYTGAQVQIVPMYSAFVLAGRVA
ncbi:MAG: NlpC/P60 family protein [Acidimicrobiales bacterium]